MKNEGNCLQCQGLLGSSVYVGLQSNYDLQDDDCEELNFGLQEGRSEENIFFEQREASIAPETNTVHNRCYNEKYLNLDEDFHQSWKNVFDPYIQNCDVDSRAFIHSILKFVIESNNILAVM